MTASQPVGAIDPVSIRLCQLLDARSAPYRLIHHGPTLTSAESAVARAQAGAGDAVGAKALLVKMVRGPAKAAAFNVMVLPSHMRLDSASVKSALPDLSSFRFATRAELLDLTGLLPGSLPPFGPQLFDRVGHLFVDPRLYDFPLLGFNCASLTRSVIISCAAYTAVAEPSMIFEFGT